MGMGERVKRSGLWWGAIAFWVVGLLAMVSPAYAEASVEIGEVKFSLGSALMLFAVGLAWGDLRSKVQRNSEKIEEHIQQFHGKERKDAGA